MRRALMVGFAAVALTACGSASDEATPVAVNSAANTCDVTPTTVKAGNVVFSVQNTGSQPTEFYLYGADDAIIGEVEDIGPGVARDLVVNVPAGTYTTACKPGQTGEGIRGQFTAN